MGLLTRPAPLSDTISHYPAAVTSAHAPVPHPRPTHLQASPVTSSMRCRSAPLASPCTEPRVVDRPQRTSSSCCCAGYCWRTRRRWGDAHWGECWGGGGEEDHASDLPTSHSPLQDLVELAADSLLPLLMSEGETFGALCTGLAASQPDAAAAARVAGALSRLVPSGMLLAGAAGGSSQEPSRQVKRLFRQGLSTVVSEVRSLIRMR